ncbi:hypothetical protein BD779DRAFT_1669409 [Infundibulicybe gibba]|nr:hypothetical protein BD779DRAFT_1669409 [Infundibulicybe gibba]
MEVLGATIALPAIFSAATKTLAFAWNQYNNVGERKHQCKVILQQCQDLVDEISSYHSTKNGLTESMSDSLRFLESACLATHLAVTTIAKKPFAWRLLHQDIMTQYIREAESAITTAGLRFNLNTHIGGQRLQTELAAARQDDHNELVLHLQTLAENDHKILDALQQDGKERRQIQELLVALTKHVQNIGPQSNEDGPANKFSRTATMALQRLSNQNKPLGISRWSVTSLDVTFDHNDEQSCIGRGGFGRIYKGEWRGKLVAVKEMHWEDARSLNSEDLYVCSTICPLLDKSLIQPYWFTQGIRHEIEIWSQLKHPHILPFYCACLEASQPFMVSKLCEYGNANQYLRAFPRANRGMMVYEVCLGMNYLHCEGVLHADLKASNILIADDGTALIADFGLSHFQDQVSSRRSTSKTPASRGGSLRWMAPERLEGEPPRKAADVYSFALTAWEIYTGSVPFSDVHDLMLGRKIIDKKERPARPPLLENDVLWGLVQECWDPNPKARPGFNVLHARLYSLVSVKRLSVPPTPHARSITPTRARFPSSAISPAGISPAPSTDMQLPHVDNLTLNPNQDDPTSLSDLDQAKALLSALTENPKNLEKVKVLQSLHLLSRAEDGRTAIRQIPELYDQFQIYLTLGSSDAKEETLGCLLNLTWEEEGKSLLLRRPGLFPPIVTLLWQGSADVKANAARLLGRLVLIRQLGANEQTLIFQPAIIEALQNLLSQRASPKEREQSVKCLVSFTCVEGGQKIIIARRGMLSELAQLLTTGTPDARQNAARCLANLSHIGGPDNILGLPNIIDDLSLLVRPGSSIPENEQSMRCLQYLTYSGKGQTALIDQKLFLSHFVRLLSGPSLVVKSHTIGCCRNLCHTSSGVNAIFTQRGLPHTLKDTLVSNPNDEIKAYLLATFFWVIHWCIDTPIGSLPTRHDRQGFLSILEELLSHSIAQEKAAACLCRLCSDPYVHGSPNPWIIDIAYRPSLLLALSNPALENAEAQSKASRCLSLIAQESNGEEEHNFQYHKSDTQPQVI